MKLLLIMRHAKSSRDDPALADFDRPLNERGEKDADRMGTLLKKKKLIPDRIVSSPALRARLTAEKVSRACVYPGEIRWEESFYGATPSEYVRGLRALPDTLQKVMIVGHNPGMESLLAGFIGRPEPLPTAAIVCLEFAMDNWKDMKPNSPARLQHFWKPKEL